jgi:hypothetical protein
MSTSFFGNLWSLLVDENYFIPSESNIFKFEITKMNDGSGDWWLYGEDNLFYYALNQENKNPKYFILKKTNTTIGFNKLDYSTWPKP